MHTGQWVVVRVRALYENLWDFLRIKIHKNVYFGAF